jgi:uroporphyrinogen decarboxylase
VLHLEEPDRVPFYELFADPEILEAITKDTLPRLDAILEKDEIVGKAIKQYVRVSVKFYHILGYDYVPLTFPFRFPRNNIILAEDTAKLSRGKRQWQNENRGVIETREDFDRYPWPDLDRVQENYLFVYNVLKENLPEGMKIIPLTPGGVLENVMWLMGAIPFFKALYNDPSLIRDMFEKVWRIISYCCELGSEGEAVGAMCMGDDMGYKNGPMMSPGHFRKYVFPWQRRCVENTHKNGKPFILHSCGDLKLIMDDLIDYVGIDAKHSYEDSSYSVIEYKKNYGDEIAILGGVDMDKICRMPEDEFRLYVRNVLRECAPGGGYALGCGNTAANYINLKNYLTMLEIGKKYGRYPVS